MRLAGLTTVCCVAVLGACATGYKPESEGNHGGYSETKRGPGVWQVWFVSNDEATQDRTDDFALLRGAELCLAEDKPFMRAGKFDSRAEEIGYTSGWVRHLPTEIGPPIGGMGPPTQVRRTAYMPGRMVYQFHSALEVTCLAEKTDDAQDAASVATELRQRYGIDAPRSAS